MNIWFIWLWKKLLSSKIYPFIFIISNIYEHTHIIITKSLLYVPSKSLDLDAIQLAHKWFPRNSLATRARFRKADKMFVRSTLPLESATLTTKNIRKHHPLYPSPSRSFVLTRIIFIHTPILVSPRRPRPSKDPPSQTKHFRILIHPLKWPSL